jgi:hypothetical protein
VSLPVPAAAAETKAEPEAWWSLKPLVRPAMPVDAPRLFSSSTNPIDSFIAEGLARKKLSPTPEADRRTLIRRLYFDLVGLPPTPEDIESFVEDRDPNAYARLVDRLLASPRYGERWARHWLDIVHFGETHGYDKDQPRPNAWPYRDYVIRAFNEDKPFTRFVQEQVAGDVLFPGTRDGIEALGFVAAGPWDLIGHAEVPESKIDGKIARHLDRDDMVVNTIQTFNSLTIQCAQCHNHKFDPIPQEDYYRLQAVFAAVDRTNKKYDTDPAVAKRRAELEGQQKTLVARRQELEAAIAARAGAALTNLDQKIAEGEKRNRNRAAFGFHSNIEKSPDTLKWVQVDLGHGVVLGSIVLHPCYDDYNSIGDGFGFPVRFKVEVSNDSEFKDGVHVVADHLGADVPNPKLQAQSYDAGGKSARYVRVTASRLALRQDDYIFALAELEALTADGHNAALGAKVASLDSIEAPVRWQRKNLTDGWYPGAAVTDSQELTELKEKRKALLEASTEPGEKTESEARQQELTATKAALDKLPPLSTAYVAAVHTGSGAFAGTGAKGGQPRPICILPRGNVQKPGAEVGPGALSAVQGLEARFNLPAGHGEGERRAALARWLTERNHPLTWRSVVNRVWQYHFGRGLVETPNDFGRMGATPTHPALLDWLAVEFRDGGQSFKTLHRLIVTSATYRQGSILAGSGDSKATAPDPRTIDPDNRYLWRQTRRKLEAESVRDSILFVSGTIDLKMGGPSFQDFVVEKPEHSPHYQYHLSDPEDPKCHRRSVYRFVVRSQQQPFMTTLDCADPSMQVARRNESVSPLQALTLLNNSLVLAMSKHFAAKLQKLDGPLDRQVQRGYYEVTGHPPPAEDLEMLAGYARDFGLTNLCRVLFNLNEAGFVD